MRARSDRDDDRAGGRGRAICVRARDASRHDSGARGGPRPASGTPGPPLRRAGRAHPDVAQALRQRRRAARSRRHRADHGWRRRGFAARRAARGHVHRGVARALGGFAPDPWGVRLLGRRAGSRRRRSCAADPRCGRRVGRGGLGPVARPLPRAGADPRLHRRRRRPGVRRRPAGDPNANALARPRRPCGRVGARLDRSHRVDGSEGGRAGSRGPLQLRGLARGARDVVRAGLAGARGAGTRARRACVPRSTA